MAFDKNQILNLDFALDFIDFIPSFNIVSCNLFSVQDLILGAKIGVGSSAIVYASKYSGTQVAVKETYFEGADRETSDELAKVCDLSPVC